MMKVLVSLVLMCAAILGWRFLSVDRVALPSENKVSPKSQSITAPRETLDDNEVTDITPVIAKKRLEEIRVTIPDIAERRIVASDIITELCKSGYLDEAWSMIEESAGTVRQWQLSAFFRHADINTSELLGKIENLPYGGEAKSALASKFAGMSLSDIDTFIGHPTFVQFLKKDDANNNLLRETLKYDLIKRGKIAKDPDAMTKAVEWKDQGLLEKNDLISVLAADPNPSPWERWRLVSEHVVSNDLHSFPGILRSNTIKELVMGDAAQAADLLSEGVDDQTAWDLGQAIKEWTKLDSKPAMAWYAKNAYGLSGKATDAVAIAQAELALDFKEMDSARDWINQIESPEQKQKFVELLNGVE